MPPHPRFRSGTTEPRTGSLLRLGRLLLLSLPVSLLLLASLRVPAETALLLWLGTLFQGIACLMALWTGQGGREPLGPALIMLYVIGLGWLLFGATGQNDWFLYVAQAVLLVVPVGLFAIQCLRDSGATTMRRARYLASCLRSRRDWPADLMQCRSLPEVKALREALHIDASPALELLVNPNPAVRVAALAALEYRPSWRPGQPEVVLQLSQRAPEAEVRAAAVNALANVDDRGLIEALCDRLHDPSPLVRATATEAVLFNSEQRWDWVRHHLRQALGNPALHDDGPLRLTGQALPQEVIDDWHAWCAEKGGVGLRAAMTLGVYYGQQLSAGAAPDLVARLRKELTATGTPPMLRLELARLLYQTRELTPDEMRFLLSPAMPAPVRLIAAEALLAMGTCPDAVSALHDLARLPNREIALSTAEVVQKRLGIELGLQQGHPLPPVQSRTAAEVVRRLLMWANQFEVTEQPAPPLRSHPSSRVNL
jgi:hypothetical protein